MTALLLDIGNTRLKWAVLEEGSIRRTGHILRDRIQDKGLQALTTRLPRRVDAVLASNVAGGSFATRLSGIISAHCNCELRFARSERHAWGVSNGYRQPRRLGVDRWVAMIAAWNELQQACLVVDAGTAVTLDAIDDEGHHLGGQIIPGLETMWQSLSSATSDLPLVKSARRAATDDLSMFGRNTTAAIRKGAGNAVAGAIVRSLQVLQSSACEPVLVLTGGGASRILDTLGVSALHRPDLVLQGLAHMLECER